MLPAVIRTSFLVFCVIFRLWKCSCLLGLMSPLLTLLIAVLVSQEHPSGCADQKQFAYSEIQKAL